ncbi:MAG: enoyl-CoA hydratase-related protein [Polyangiaceae bacterium]
MTLDPKSFSLEISRGVAAITLDRPERLNALTFEIYGELASTFRSLDKVPEARAVTITGKGRGFCSGGDVEGIIRELFSRDIRALLDFTRVTGALIQSIRELRRPVIAAVNGVAVGAGAVIAAACDLRIFAESAKIGFIFPRVGLSGADMGASFLLPRIVGHGRAAELLFFGDIIPAKEAYSMGLANRLVPDAEVVPVAASWAERLARGPAFAHTVTKQMLESEHGMSLRRPSRPRRRPRPSAWPTPTSASPTTPTRPSRLPRFQGAEICDAPAPAKTGD